MYMGRILALENRIAFDDKVCISDFKRTVRNELDFNRLMHCRIDLMK